MAAKKLNFLKSFIIKNVDPPEKGFVTKFWPKEMKIAKDLYLLFPDEKFWMNINLGFKVKSLSWFKTEKYASLLENKYKEYKFIPKQNNVNELNIEDRKFGDTIHNNKRPKFLKDFLT